MTTPGKRDQTEKKAKREQHEKWGHPAPEVLAKAIDDIRARVVEEGWFGRSLYEVSHEVADLFRPEDLYGRDEQNKGREAEQETREKEKQRNHGQELEI